MQIYVGTSNGVYRLDGRDLIEVGLAGERVSAIYADGSVVLAGTYGNGLYRSADDGQSWQHVSDGLTASAFRTIVRDPLDASAILAGTEPARLYRSSDGGQTWTEAAGIPALPPVDEWYLPYSPRAGALRNVYAPSGGQRLLASVEVGGLLDSPDGGESWSIAPVIRDDDIHHITGHPDDPQLLYASLGYAALKSNSDRGDYKLGGVGRSRDGGKSWEKVENDYTRATLIPSTDTSLLLAGPAPHVGREGRIVVSSDGGDTWQNASGGLESPMRDMVELFVEAPDTSIWAVCSGGRLLRAEAGAWQWETIVADDASFDAEAVAFVP